MKNILVILFAILCVSVSYAQNKVVVIPLDASTASDQSCSLSECSAMGTALLSCGDTSLLILCFGPFAIGDIGPGGGIVFHITDGGLRGLEAAPVDQDMATWGCHGTSIDGADGAELGTGNQNTADILEGCATRPIAASVAAAYMGPRGDSPGWFLPSTGESILMYQNLHLNDLGGFNNTGGAGGAYWTSTETFDNRFAFFQDYETGSQPSFTKLASTRVRAIRSF